MDPYYTYLSTKSDYSPPFIPAYVGNWAVDGKNIGEHVFELFIDTRVPTEDGIDCITGVIKDMYGLARFVGAVCEKVISFSMWYTKEAIENGAYADRIECEAKLTSSLEDRGTFRYMGGGYEDLVGEFLINEHQYHPEAKWN